jgi:hypothetical protein
MPTRGFSCVQCDAIFKVTHNLEDSYYEVMFCPFCGAEIDDETEEEEDDTY